MFANQEKTKVQRDIVEQSYLLSKIKSWAYSNTSITDEQKQRLYENTKDLSDNYHMKVVRNGLYILLDDIEVSHPRDENKKVTYKKPKLLINHNFGYHFSIKGILDIVHPHYYDRFCLGDQGYYIDDYSKRQDLQSCIDILEVVLSSCKDDPPYVSRFNQAYKKQNEENNPQDK